MNNNIKQLRLAKKLSQKQLGKLLGVSNAHIHFLELGKHKPSRKLLSKMSNIDNLNIDMLSESKLDFLLK